jgi:hypothetical protein
MREEDHAVADRLIPVAVPLLEAWFEERYDYLGELFTEKECGIEGMGQIMTPLEIVSFMNDSALDAAREDEEDGRWTLVLDPCTGTGRFLLDLAWRHRHRKLALFGVELDLDLYRACLVNMRLYALGIPYFILRANALIVDLTPGSPNWRCANRWSPPDWETEMVTPSGETYAQWRADHGFGEPHARVGPGSPPDRLSRGEVGPRVQRLVEDLPLFRELEGGGDG